MQKYYRYIIIGSFIFFIWVYFQGTIDKVLFKELVPLKIPEEFFNVNQWLKDQKGDFKALWLPPQFQARVLDWAKDRKINDFLTVSSGKPAIGPQAPYSRLYYLFFESIINSAPRLDKFFSILNGKYIIFRKDLPEDYSDQLLQNLQENPQFKQIKNHGYLTVFENKNFAPHLWVPQENDLVVGGLEALDILNSQEKFNPLETGLVFANQKPNLLYRMQNLKFKNIIFNNADFNDLVFALVEDKYLIQLSSLTDEGRGEWRKAASNEPLHGEWHRVIDTLRIPNWDFDFGKGLIYAEDQAVIRVPLKIQDKEKYLLLMRYFQNNKGGKFKIILGKKEEAIRTLDLNNRFKAVNLGLALSNQGDYWIEIQNLVGFNAINLIALVPEKRYKEYESKAKEIINKVPVVYLEKLNALSADQALNFNLPKDGRYQIAVRLKSNLSQTQTNQNSQQVQRFKIRLAKQEYQLKPALDQKMSWYSLKESYFSKKQALSLDQEQENASLLSAEDFFILDPGNLQFKEFKKGELEGKLEQGKKVIILKNPQSPEKEGRLITHALRVAENQGFYLEYKFQGEDLAGIEGRILFYGKDYDPVFMRRAFKVEYFMQGAKGDLEERKISHFFGTPQNTYYLKLEFKAKANLKKESWFQISDLKLFPQERLNVLDALMLTEQRGFSQTNQNRVVLKYIKLNPARYMVSFSNLEDLSQPFLLSFAESYNPDWVLKDRSFLEKDGRIVNYFNKRIRSLAFKPGSQDRLEALPLYSVVNGFYVDLQKMKSNKFILEYEPQNWFELGLWISLGTLGSCLMGLIIYRFVKRAKKNI